MRNTKDSVEIDDSVKELIIKAVDKVKGKSYLARELGYKGRCISYRINWMLDGRLTTIKKERLEKLKRIAEK